MSGKALRIGKKDACIDIFQTILAIQTSGAVGIFAIMLFGVCIIASLMFGSSYKCQESHAVAVLRRILRSKQTVGLSEIIQARLIILESHTAECPCHVTRIELARLGHALRAFKKLNQTSITVVLVTLQPIDISQCGIRHIVGSIALRGLRLKHLNSFLGIHNGIVILAESCIKSSQVGVTKMTARRNVLRSLTLSDVLASEIPLFGNGILPLLLRLLALLVIVSKLGLLVRRSLDQRVHSLRTCQCLPHITHDIIYGPQVFQTFHPDIIKSSLLCKRQARLQGINSP